MCSYVCIPGDTKCLAYMRVPVCGSCAGFMLEGSAKKFCFNDLGIVSSEILTLGHSQPRLFLLDSCVAYFLSLPLSPLLFCFTTFVP